jgi:multiple antibiotic resistance protein
MLHAQNVFWCASIFQLRFSAAARPSRWLVVSVLPAWHKLHSCANAITRVLLLSKYLTTLVGSKRQTDYVTSVNNQARLFSFVRVNALNEMINFKEIFSVTLILFSVIDILGSIPFIILIRKREGKIQAEKATIISGALMILFLYLGQSILQLFGLDVASFAVAGAIVIFIVAMEMILGITLIKDDPQARGSSSIVPLAFPLIAGAGTLTTILSLRAVYQELNIVIGMVLNLVIVYTVLRSSAWLERVIGESGFAVLRRIFGVILLAIAVKIFKSNVFPG